MGGVWDSEQVRQKLYAGPKYYFFFFKLKIDFSIQYIVISFPSPNTSLILPTSPPIQRFILFLCICKHVLYVYVHG